MTIEPTATTCPDCGDTRTPSRVTDDGRGVVWACEMCGRGTVVPFTATDVQP